MSDRLYDDQVLHAVARLARETGNEPLATLVGKVNELWVVALQNSHTASSEFSKGYKAGIERSWQLVCDGLRLVLRDLGGRP